MRVRMWLRKYLKWLLPGLGVKRWLAVVAIGIALLALAAVLIMGPIDLVSFGSRIGVGFLPGWSQALILGLVGGAAVGWGLTMLQRNLLAPFARGQTPVVDTLYYHRMRERGPRIVAIGGGHGLATLLRGLKRFTSNITAIVTVADDGGSSGRLRHALGVLPPGDFRNCITALADDESLVTQLFQYRFPAAPADAGLDGHNLGNLFITAMADVAGSFERAVLECSRVLSISGRVIPSTLESVTLVGDLRAEPARLNRVTGESSITRSKGVIERVYLEPDDAPAYPEAVRAILEADLIVAGPGSLYTSVLPNLLVREIAQAIAASRAVRVYVCNVATQLGETDGFSVADHVDALENHLGPGLFPLILANGEFINSADLSPGVEPVTLELPPDAHYLVMVEDLVDSAHPWRHDSDRLARALIRTLHDGEVSGSIGLDINQSVQINGG